MQNSVLAPELQVSMDPRPHLRFSAFKTATLAPELQVSIGPSPHLWFLYAKERLLDQKFKFYWSQTSPVVLCIHNSDIMTRINGLYGFPDLTCGFVHSQQRDYDQNY